MIDNVKNLLKFDIDSSDAETVLRETFGAGVSVAIAIICELLEKIKDDPHDVFSTLVKTRLELLEELKKVSSDEEKKKLLITDTSQVCYFVVDIFLSLIKKERKNIVTCLTNQLRIVDTDMGKEKNKKIVWN